MSRAEREKRERTQAQVGLASNLVGLGAGGAATIAAARDERFKDPKAPKVRQRLGKLGDKLPHITPKAGKAGAYTAAGAAGLQLLNVGGDVVTNAVLRRESGVKKESPMKVPENVEQGIEVAQATVGRPFARDWMQGTEQVAKSGAFGPEIQQRLKTAESANLGKYRARVSAADADGSWASVPANDLTGRAMQSHRGALRLQDGAKKVGLRRLVRKARSFDPEDDRQRRIGAASGVLAGGAVVAGDRAARHIRLERADDAVKLKLGPKAKGAGLAALAAGLGTGAAATYRHGISERNKRWT